MSVSIGGLFIAGIIPGILIGLAQMVAVYVYARRHGMGLHDRAKLRELASALAGAGLALLTPIIIVGGIVGGFFTPTEASVVAALYALALGLIIYRTVGGRKLAHVFYDTGRFASIALFCIGTASAFGWTLAYFRIPAALVGYVQTLDLGIAEMGFAVAISFLVIGCFIDAIPAIIILGTVLYPVTQAVGMHPIHFAMIGIISLAFGLVTPPYGLCLLISCSIAGIPVKKALRDVALILLPMLAILMLVILFPSLTLWLPRLMMPQFVN